MPISESTIEHTKMDFEACLTTELIDWILLKEDLKYLPTEIEVYLAPIIDVLQRVSIEKL